MIRLTEELCNPCGSQMEVETEAPDDYYYDGDILTCPNCNHIAWVCEVDEGASIIHDDE